jgi:hypothetical protein
MRALAQFIMRGRLQACVVALVGNLLPMISPATVALVTLKRSFSDGLLVLLWAALPLLVAVFYASASTLVAVTSLVGLISVVIASEILKSTASWQLALIAVLLTCALGVQISAGLLPAETTSVLAQVNQLLADQDNMTTSAVSPFFVLLAITALGLGIETANAVLVLGFLAWLTAIGAISGLLLGRWWQAILFNPGGFQQEFHGLHLQKVLASGLMIAVVACNLLAPEYKAWGSLFGLPLLLAGVGLAHFGIRARKMGVVWLVVMYVGLVLFGPLSMVLIVVGFLDSFLNLRTRLGDTGRNH